jgi:hypothetical protein
MYLSGSAFADSELTGTYLLVSSTRTIVETGQTIDSFGKDPVGYIMYGSDGRMMVLMVRSDRPKPTFKTLTDSARAELFESMAAYSGTFDFDGKKVVHHIDASWNGILTGTDVVRSVEKKGRRLIYTTNQSPSPTDGKISTSMLIWEKVDDAKR